MKKAQHVKVPWRLQPGPYPKEQGGGPWWERRWIEGNRNPTIRPRRDKSRLVAGIRKAIGVPTKATHLASLVRKERAGRAKDKADFERSMGTSNKGAGQEPEI